MHIFLYTDIEGSTQLWEQHGRAMGAVLHRHDQILRDCINGCGGRMVKHTGDGVFAVFDEVEARPLECALAIQRQVAAEVWPGINELRIRIALHAGSAEQRAEDYFGPAVNRTARLLSTAWGGQIILTPEVSSLAPLPDGARLNDLGVHLLKDLAEPQQVYGLIHDDLTLQVFPTLRSMSSQPNNLPRQPTPLVGRQRELAEIGELVSRPECRLLTLVAPGGMGKTRLGLQAAANQIESFRNGVFFVPLAGVNSPDSIPSSIANSLRFSFYGAEDLEIQLQNYLREKQLLLLLDNFEHLIEGAESVADLLTAAPELKILVTSRRQLQLQAEWTYDVVGLPVPDNGRPDYASDDGAVELFLQSARQIKAGLEPSPEEMRAVIDICRLVEGMPLALELAAAWVRTLSCREIAAEIKKDLDILSTEMRDVPPRHRSIRAVFEHSWNELKVAERNVLARLSVFRGGFTRKAAHEVTGATLRIISELINKSLLSRDSDGRFHIHELLRQLAAEKLSESETIAVTTAEGHAAYFSGLLKELETPLIRGERISRIEEINQELDNILLAWGWAIKNNGLSVLENSMRSLYLFYEARSWYSEGEEFFRTAVESLRSREAAERLDDRHFQFILTNLLLRQAWFIARLSHYKDARDLMPAAVDSIIEESDLEGRWVIAGLETNTLYGLGEFEGALSILEQYDELYEAKYGYSRSWPWSKAQSMANMGRIHGALGNYDKAKRLLQDALEILRPLGDHIGVMLYLHTLGGIVLSLGETEYARTLFEENLELAEKYEYPMGKTLSLSDLGDLAYETGDYPAALDRFQASLELSGEMGDRRGRALALTSLGRVATASGEYSKARIFYQQSLGISTEAGNRRAIAVTLNQLSKVHRLLGDGANALDLSLESQAICEDLGYRKGVVQAQITRAETDLERGDFQSAEAVFGESLSGSEVLGFALGEILSLTGLGRAAFALEQMDTADERLNEALRVARGSHFPRAVLGTLLALGETYAATNKPERATELLAMVENHPAADHDTRSRAARGLERLRANFSREEFEAIVSKGRALTLESVL